MRRWIQFSVFPLWFVLGPPSLRWMVSLSPPIWIAATAGIAWMVGIIPVFLFSIGYHEHPRYDRRPTVSEDAKSAISALVEYLKYMAWIFVIGVALVLIGSLGYTE